MSFILIVEDDENQLESYKNQLEVAMGEEVRVLTATTIQRAEQYFFGQLKRQIIGMIVDGAVPGGYLNAIPFIQRVRAEGYQVVMVAASTRIDYRKTMVEYGCTDESEKRHAVKRLVELLSQ